MIERNMQTYKDVLIWSILFLKNKSFDLYCGKTISYALVFPMELLYQDFIAKKIEHLSQGRYTIEKQQKDTLLEQFQIIPDIVVNVGDRRYILDTKWKKLKPDDKPSENDLYQMYVYTTKMNSAETILIYPKCYPENSPKSYSEKVFDQKIIISTWFVDLNNIDDSLSELIEHFVEG